MYDAADRVGTVTDGRGQVLAFDYDVLDRRTAVRTGSAAGPVAASWAFDTVAKGLPTSSTRFDSGNAYVKAVTGYDPAYRPTGTSVTIPAVAGEEGLGGTYTTTATYNIDGGVKTKKVPALPGTGVPTETLTYTYNTLGNPQKLGGDGGAYMAEATYTPYGEPDKYQIGTVPANSAYQTFGYRTGTHRLASMRLDRFNQPAAVSTVSYTYDPAGNVTSTTDTSAGQPVDTQCFGYDYLRRLTQAWTPTAGCAAAPSTAGLGGPAPYWQTYTFDKTGNRTTLTSHAAGGDTVATGTYPAPGATRPHFLTSLATAGPAGTSTRNVHRRPGREHRQPDRRRRRADPELGCRGAPGQCHHPGRNHVVRL